MKIDHYLTAIETAHAGGISAARLGQSEAASAFVYAICRLAIEMSSAPLLTQQGFRTAYSACSVADEAILGVISTMGGDYEQATAESLRVRAMIAESDQWAAKINYEGGLGEAERHEVEKRAVGGGYCKPSALALLRWLEGPRDREQEPGWDFPAIEAQLRRLRGLIASARLQQPMARGAMSLD